MPSIDDLAGTVMVIATVFTISVAVTLTLVATADPRHVVRARAERLLTLLFGRQTPPRR